MPRYYNPYAVPAAARNPYSQANENPYPTDPRYAEAGVNLGRALFGDPQAAAAQQLSQAQMANLQAEATAHTAEGGLYDAKTAGEQAQQAAQARYTALFGPEIGTIGQGNPDHFTPEDLYKARAAGAMVSSATGQPNGSLPPSADGSPPPAASPLNEDQQRTLGAVIGHMPTDTTAYTTQQGANYQQAGINGDIAKEQAKPQMVPQGGTLLVPDQSAWGAPAKPAAGTPIAAATPGSGAVTPIAGPIGAMITTQAQHAGATPTEVAYLQRTAQIESSGDPSKSNGSSTGLFQFHPSTFQKVMPGGDINNPADQVTAALTLARKDYPILQSALGRPPTGGEVYLAHQQGAAGAKALLTAPIGMNAIIALEHSGVDPRLAKLSILGNGGTAGMTAVEFSNMVKTKFGDTNTPEAQAAQAAGMASAAPGGGATPTSAPVGYHVAYQAPAKADAADEVTPLTKDSLDYVARQYMINGQLPPLGMGKNATSQRAAIINRAVEIEAETGSTGADAAVRHMNFKAAQSGLNTVTRQRGIVEAAEGTAEQNAQLVLSLAQKTGLGGVPVLNRWINAGRQGVAGDPDVQAFQSALMNLQAENAKINSGSTTGQGASDASRRDAADQLPSTSTYPQLVSTIGAMRTEWGNRKNSLMSEEQAFRDQVNRKGAPSTSSNSAPAPAAAPAAPAHQPAPANLSALRKKYGL